MLSVKNTFSMGRKALDKAKAKRELQLARWTRKNAPSSLTDEQKVLLKIK